MMPALPSAAYRLARWPGPLRIMLADLLGYDDAEPPAVPAQLPEAARAAVQAGIAEVIDYQGPGYAQLYMQRLGRFIGRRGVDEAMLAAIARILAARMACCDAPRIADLKLRGEGADIPDRIEFRLSQILSSLPSLLGEPALAAAGRLKCRELRFRLRFAARSPVRRLYLRGWSRIGRWRLTTTGYREERALVERWLHMIDRSLTLRPEAAAEIVATGALVHGTGAAYRRRIGIWHALIDGLAKPVFDGRLALPDLPAALAEARAAALGDPAPAEFAGLIARLRGAGAAAGKNEPALPKEGLNKGGVF